MQRMLSAVFAWSPLRKSSYAAQHNIAAFPTTPFEHAQDRASNHLSFGREIK